MLLKLKIPFSFWLKLFIPDEIIKVGISKTVSLKTFRRESEDLSAISNLESTTSLISLQTSFLESDGDYFERDSKGNIIAIKKGKKKIDLSKLTRDELQALGIDPDASPGEIARLLKEKFGDAIRIVDGGKLVGHKKYSDYGKDIPAEVLARDPELDVNTSKCSESLE